VCYQEEEAREPLVVPGYSLGERGAARSPQEHCGRRGFLKEVRERLGQVRPADVDDVCWEEWLMSGHSAEAPGPICQGAVFTAANFEVFPCSPSQITLITFVFLLIQHSHTHSPFHFLSILTNQTTQDKGYQ